MNKQKLTRPIESFTELGARNELENEWWYYHGHLKSESRRFGFHMVFFRRRGGKIRIAGLLPVNRITEQLRFAHFAVTDIDRQQFQYGHRRALLGDAGAEKNHYRVWVGNWSACDDDEVHRVRANIRDAALDLKLQPQKPLVRHGDDGTIRTSLGRSSRYLAFTRMSANGRLKVRGDEFQVAGEAWMDHVFGDFAMSPDYHGWDWFGIQFDNGHELMVYRVRDENGLQTEQSIVTFIDPDGSTTRLDAERVDIETLEHWTSQATGTVYPIRWQVRLPEIDADLEIEPFLRSHELDTRGSTNLIYWEGPGSVTGRLNGRSVTGRCYQELAGYGGGKRKLGIYDFSTNGLGIVGGLFNEFKLRKYGPGITVAQGNNNAEMK